MGMHPSYPSHVVIYIALRLATIAFATLTPSQAPCKYPADRSTAPGHQSTSGSSLSQQSIAGRHLRKDSHGGSLNDGDHLEIHGKGHQRSITGSRSQKVPE
ncbi:hypothetical protein ARMGADRAFT_164496 [Armillaria gallica]|uniref:Hypervirulence associated protein TUDOR domain-containing protein n=1 Tax=Armillaria gallica TaxID=47427 RepID=A0A2H3DW81_ARMGA|nr:hypothetical protein ARMGADRAFT_164496 [Armillaria gallica]